MRKNEFKHKCLKSSCWLCCQLCLRDAADQQKKKNDRRKDGGVEIDCFTASDTCLISCLRATSRNASVLCDVLPCAPIKPR